MTDNQLDAIRQRIKKLLALSKSPNENEALSAIEKANDMMESYGFNKNDFTEYSIKKIKSTKRYCEWRAVLANAVENLYATYHYKNMEGSVIFCGEEIDVLMSTEMFVYLTKAVERITKNNVRKNAKYKYRQSYKAGIANRIYDKMEELGQSCSWRNKEEISKRKTEISTWAHSQLQIVRIEKKIKINPKAFSKGEIDGDNISLNRQMTTPKNRMIESTNKEKRA